MNMRRLFSAFFLLFVFVGALATLPMFRFRSIVIHHTATPGGDYQSIKNAHKGRWFDIAYHLVLTNGHGNQPLGRLQTGKRHFFLMHSAGTKNKACNFMDLHLCVAGNYHETEVPEEMKVQIVSAIKAAQDRYRIPDDRIKLHRDCSNTECPGKNITKTDLQTWLKNINPDQKTLEAHRNAIAEDYLGPIPRGPLLVILPVLLLLLVFRAPVPGAPSSIDDVSGDGDA